jgi:hypothetical protein
MSSTEVAEEVRELIPAISRNSIVYWDFTQVSRILASDTGHMDSDEIEAWPIHFLVESASLTLHVAYA